MSDVIKMSVRLYPEIRRGEHASFFKAKPYRGPIPSADRSVIVGPSWFCIPERVVDGFDNPRQAQYGIPQQGRRFVMAAYCGAPPGIRCKCGAQLHGHDAGDEDPRCP